MYGELCTRWMLSEHWVAPWRLACWEVVKLVATGWTGVKIGKGNKANSNEPLTEGPSTTLPTLWLSVDRCIHYIGIINCGAYCTYLHTRTPSYHHYFIWGKILYSHVTTQLPWQQNWQHTKERENPQDASVACAKKHSHTWTQHNKVQRFRFWEWCASNRMGTIVRVWS